MVKYQINQYITLCVTLNFCGLNILTYAVVTQFVALSSQLIMSQNNVQLCINYLTGAVSNELVTCTTNNPFGTHLSKPLSYVSNKTMCSSV